MPDIYIRKPKTEPENTPPQEPAEDRSNALREELRSLSQAPQAPQDPQVHKSAKERKKTDANVKKESSEKAKPLTDTQEDMIKKKKGHFHPKNGTFSALSYLPEKVKFEIQDRGEEVVLMLRRHPIVNIKWIVVSLVLFFAPTFIFSIPGLDFLPAGYILSLSIIWYLVTFAYALEGFLNWFFNVGLVTDERVIDIDFHNILYKEISATKIDTIQDVTYSQSGSIQSIFDFGDIHIQTAAEKRQFEFLQVPQPSRIVGVINDLKLEEEQEKIEGRVR